jgi:hypothetical protein
MQTAAAGLHGIEAVMDGVTSRLRISIACKHPHPIQTAALSTADEDQDGTVGQILKSLLPFSKAALFTTAEDEMMTSYYPHLQHHRGA